MIKSQDKTAVRNRQPPFSETDISSGIAFETSNGMKRFAPNSFLSCVDFDGKSELIFRYTFGTIIVQGHALEPIWDALCRGSLANIIEQSHECLSENTTSIRAILIEDAEDVSTASPFPEGSSHR